MSEKEFIFEDGSKARFVLNEEGFACFIQAVELPEGKTISTSLLLNNEETNQFLEWINGVLNGL